MNSKLASTVGALFFSMLAAGCGGGGGDVADAADALPGMVASSVTVDNAESMVAQGYAAMSNLGAQSDLANMFVTGVSISAHQINLVDTSLALLYKKQDAGGNLVVGATVTENCTNGGSVTVTDSPTSLSITANNCREDGLRINGGLSFTFSNMTGTVGANTAWSGTMAINYQNLSIEVDGAGLRIGGDMTLAYSQSSGNVSNASISGQSLHVRYLENGSIVLNSLLQSFSFTTTMNFSAYTHSANFTYAANGSGVTPVSYTLATNTQFQSTGSAYPHAGSLTITATDNSTVTLTALSSTNVRLDLDLDGNGSIDETINTTWTALAN